MTAALAPYRGLVPYTEEDAAFFFGREAEQRRLVASLMASPFTILYGPSGVGKSSMLRAGVLARLRERARAHVATGGTPEFVPVYYADWLAADPVAGLSCCVGRAVHELVSVDGPPADGASMTATLTAWSEASDAELLIVLDQFEEYFVYHPEPGVGRFDVEFTDAVNDAELRASFLLAIREDAFARLDRFRTRIPRLFETARRVGQLDATAARAAITGPLERYNELRDPAQPPVTIEPELVDEIVESVGSESVIRSTDATPVPAMRTVVKRVEAPMLQLVLDRLWQVEQERGSSTIRLATLHQLGGGPMIVRTHLQRALAHLTPGEQALAADLFRFLVTPSGTTIAQRADDLAYWTEASPERVRTVLEELSDVRVRVLRALEDQSYELFSDVLAPAILEWRGRIEQMRLAARQQAERERHAEEERARDAARTARLVRTFALAMAVLAIALSFTIVLLLAERQAP